MTFDRLIFIDRLKNAGVSEPIARAHAEALRDAMGETVATKADLTAAVQATKADLTAAAQATRADLTQALQATRAELKDAIDTLDRKFDGKFETLDRKIEITARDLVIKGAGRLIVLASLMIGLKLFG